MTLFSPRTRHLQPGSILNVASKCTHSESWWQERACMHKPVDATLIALLWFVLSELRKDIWIFSVETVDSIIHIYSDLPCLVTTRLPPSPISVSLVHFRILLRESPRPCGGWWWWWGGGGYLKSFSTGCPRRISLVKMRMRIGIGRRSQVNVVG